MKNITVDFELDHNDQLFIIIKKGNKIVHLTFAPAPTRIAYTAYERFSEQTHAYHTFTNAYGYGGTTKDEIENLFKKLERELADET